MFVDLINKTYFEKLTSHTTHKHLTCSFVSRNNVALQYVRGLCWVLRYYYQGCASWRWYFPYHYAPFASDFINIGGLSTEFEKDTVPVRENLQNVYVFAYPI